MLTQWSDLLTKTEILSSVFFLLFFTTFRFHSICILLVTQHIFVLFICTVIHSELLSLSLPLWLTSDYVWVCFCMVYKRMCAKIKLMCNYQAMWISRGNETVKSHFKIRIRVCVSVCVCVHDFIFKAHHFTIIKVVTTDISFFYPHGFCSAYIHIAPNVIDFICEMDWNESFFSVYKFYTINARNCVNEAWKIWSHMMNGYSGIDRENTENRRKKLNFFSYRFGILIMSTCIHLFNYSAFFFQLLLKIEVSIGFIIYILLLKDYWTNFHVFFSLISPFL